MNSLKTAKNVIKWLIAALLITVFASITFDVVAGTAVITDDYVFFNIVMPMRSDAATLFFNAASFCGSAVVLILLAVASLLFIKDRKIGICIFSNLFIITIINLLIKLIVHRDRPPIERHLAQETNFSFPSGHAMIGMAFYGLLIYFVLRFVKNRPLKIFLTIFMMLLIVAIGVSRIYLSVHYMSDVAGGFSISGAYLICYISIIKSIFDKKT